MDDYLRAILEVKPVMTYVRFPDADGNIFTGWLEMDEKEFVSAKQRRDCPIDKSSFAYYEFLRDHADAVQCSPDAITAPLTKRAPNGDVLDVYIYGVNADGICQTSIANPAELKISNRLSRTYFMWKMNADISRDLNVKKLPWPHA